MLMSRKDAPRLGSSLIARKGEAAPVKISAQALPVEEAKSSPRGTAGTIAVTVRLDPERYLRLKTLGAQTRRKNQDLLVEALDRLLGQLS